MDDEYVKGQAIRYRTNGTWHPGTFLHWEASTGLAAVAPAAGGEAGVVTAADLRPATPIRRALTDEDKDRILTIIGTAWKTVPELRLGQLIAAFAHQVYGEGGSTIVAAQRTLDTLFFTEDADLAHELSLWAQQHSLNRE
jgi:hypothetical protein